MMTSLGDILVIGECGVGKSTLVDALRDKAAGTSPDIGRDYRGVSQDIRVYSCRHPDGTAFNLVDTPGFGNHGMSIADILVKLEAFVWSMGGGPRRFSGLLVTTPLLDASIGFVKRLMQSIMAKGFLARVGDDEYANVVLVGTKLDKADDDDKKHFVRGLSAGQSVREAFFGPRGQPSRKQAVMVHRNDYGPLLDAIRVLPSGAIAFKPPDRGLAGELAKRELETQAKENQAKPEHGCLMPLELELHEAKRRRIAMEQEEDEELAQGTEARETAKELAMMTSFKRLFLSTSDVQPPLSNESAKARILQPGAGSTACG